MLLSKLVASRCPLGETGVIGSVLIGVLLWVYGGVIMHCYGLHDDYSHLWVVTYQQQHLFGLYGTQGRIIHQWLSSLAFANIDTVCGLTILRIIALATLGLFALQLYFLARRAGWAVLAALCLSVAICTTPAMGIYVAWAITFPLVFAMSLGLQAGAYVFLGTSGRIPSANVGLAGLCLIAALAIYQHAAMAFWLTAALCYFAPQAPPLLPWRRLAIAMAVFIAALAVYYAVFKLYLTFFRDDAVLLEGASRAAFSNDPFGKLIFFLQSLGVAASIGQIDTTALFIALLVVLLGSAWLMQGASWRLGLLGLGLLALAYLPSWIVQESLLKLRLLSVLSSLLMVLLFWALMTLFRQWPRYLSVVLLGVSGFTAASEWRNIQNLIILHQAEYIAIQDALIRDYQADSTKIAITRPAPQNWLSGGPSTLEYGIPTAALWHADFARVLVQQIFAETFAAKHLPDVIQCGAPNQDVCPEMAQHAELPILKLGALIKEQLPSDWPLLISIQPSPL